MKSKTTITVETWHTTSLKIRTKTFSWCKTCGRETESLTTDEAARRGHVSQQEVLRRIGNGRFHLVEDPGRVAKICAGPDGLEIEERN